MNWDEFVVKRWQWVKWSLIIAAYTLLALFSALGTIFLNKQQGLEFNSGLIYSTTFIDWYIWALLTPSIIWFIHTFSFENTSLPKKFIINIPASIVFTIVYLFIVNSAYAANRLITETPFSSEPAEYTRPYIICLAIFGVIYAFDYYHRLKERELKITQLEAKLAQAQLQVLKMQIHPHFLFNTLHAISTLIHKDIHAADNMIVQLGDLLRVTLDNAGEHEVTLKRELELLNPYLEIEKMRFHDRLHITTDISPETLSARVPNLLLQPLVENAVMHGISQRSSGGRIDVKTKKENGKLIIEISDDGIGLSGGEGAAIAEGIGISNTRARLQQLYGDDYMFSITNRSTGGVRVVITIPFQLDSPLSLYTEIHKNGKNKDNNYR